MEQHQPRLCQETEMLKIVRPGPTDSPPPNCAICLGICTNKCFTDCCLHQFCFSCLLEWSKIKAECPLCKQPFKSIIYNIKSNLEYEEHIITNSEDEVQGEDLLMDGDIDMRTGTEYLILPQRQFQYRTTFTLAPGREFAIQQLLRSHPRTNSSTNSIYLHADRYVHNRLLNPNPHSLQQRRNVYSQGLWVDPQPDITGRFRECSPSFFRENPAQIHRIFPWLNRELAALLSAHVDFYHIEEQIMEMLCQYSIRSASFRNRIVFYLGNRTDHFIHEFYNFVRSPFDMIGYDRHSTYSAQPPPVYSQSVSDDDSDVRVVDSPSNDDCIYVPPMTPEVIIIDSDSSSDSDVVIRNPSPVATPPVVNLIDSDSDDNNNVASQQPVAETNERTETNNRSPQLPIKIRYKRNRNSAEIVNKKHKDKKYGKMRRLGSDSDSYEDSDYAESHHPKSESEYSTTHFSTSSSSSSSSSSSESSSSSSSSSSDKKYVQSLILKRVKSKSRKRKNSYKTYKSNKYRNKKPSNSTREESSERNYRIKRKRSKSKKSKRKSNDSGYHNHHRSKKMKKIKVENNYFSSPQFSGDSSDENDDSCTRKLAVKEETSFSQLFDSSFETKPEPDPEPTGSESLRPETNEQSDGDRAQDLNIAGPSQGPSLRSVIVRGNKKWYSRPELEDTTTDNNSD